MKIIRTFHPVGQGAFYTEVFQDKDDTCFVVVYDCGTETGNRAMDKPLEDQITEFKRSIGSNPKIDILFISHFHADHINGLNSLLNNV